MSAPFGGVERSYPRVQCSARRRMKASPAARSSSVMYSSGWCAWSIEPGPQTMVAMPAPWKRPASVAKGTVAVALRPASRSAELLGLGARRRGKARNEHLELGLDAPERAVAVQPRQRDLVGEALQAVRDLVGVEVRQAAELPMEDAALRQDVARRAAVDGADMHRRVGRCRNARSGRRGRSSRRRCG